MNNLQDRGEKGELWRVFGKFGNLTNVWVADNPPGFAYVFFESFKDAEDAVRHLDGGKICGMKVEVKLSPIDDKRERNQRNSFPPARGRGRGGFTSASASSRGGGSYKPRGGFSSPPPERPSRYDEEVPRNPREGRADYREARSNAYTERYSERSEKSSYGRERDDYGPSSQGRGGSSYARGRGSYQSSRGHGRGDYNNGSSGSRFTDRSPPPVHRPVSSSRGRTSPVFPSRGRGGYRSESSGYEGGHQYARGHVNQGDHYSSRDGSRGRSSGEYSKKTFASAPPPEYEKKARDSRAYERSRAYASEYEQGGGGHERSSDATYREHRYRSSDKGSYRGSGPPRAYQKRERELPEKDYHKPPDYTNMRVRDRSPHRRPSYSSTSNREPFEGSSSQDERYGERPPPKERKRSLTPAGNTFEGAGFEDRTPPPAAQYDDVRPTYPEKRSHERSPLEPGARFSPAHSDYGDLPEETAEESGGHQMEDIDHYPKVEEYGEQSETLEAAGAYKDRRIEYEGRDIREVKYDDHHETERYVFDRVSIHHGVTMEAVSTQVLCA